MIKFNFSAFDASISGALENVFNTYVKPEVMGVTNQIQSHRPARSLTQRLQNRMRQKLGQKHDYEQTFQNTP